MRLWDAASGVHLATLAGHEERVELVTFSPDGRQIATGGADDIPRIWDAETGALITTLADRIALREPDGSFTWPIPPGALLPIGCRRLTQFADEYAQVAERCDPLLAEEPDP